MPVTQWNDEEDAAMQGLPHMAQLLYLRCLRRYMDYRTGVVGRARRVSLQMFREAMVVEREIGSTLREDEAVTVKQVRVALGQLERAGLIYRLPQPKKFGPLEYMLPLATVDTDFLADSGAQGSVRPREEGQERGTRARARESSSVIHLDSATCAKSRMEGRAGEGHERKGIPPEIRIDRQIDPGGVPKLGEAIQMLIEGGVNRSIAFREDHRIRLKDLLSAGATRQVIAESLRRASLAKDGRPYSVFYLEPIIRQLLSGTENRGATNASHQLRKQSGAGIIAEGCADVLDEDGEDGSE